MGRTLKMDKDPPGTLFIAASKTCSTKLIPQAVSKAYKKYKVSMINRISIFHLNNFGLQKSPSPFLKKFKILIEKLVQRYFDI